jgi:hypothetical protein
MSNKKSSINENELFIQQFEHMKAQSRGTFRGGATNSKKPNHQGGRGMPMKKYLETYTQNEFQFEDAGTDHLRFVESYKQGRLTGRDFMNNKRNSMASYKLSLSEVYN